MTIWMGNAGGNFTQQDRTLEDPNSGVRTVKRFVKFPQPFPKNPAVTVGITSVDADHQRNVRARVEAVDVTTTGFNLRFITWADSLIYGINASWLAVAV